MAWSPLGHGAIRFRHLGDLREHVAFARRPCSSSAGGCLHLLGVRLHRAFFVVRESLDLAVAVVPLAAVCVPSFYLPSAIVLSSQALGDDPHAREPSLSGVLIAGARGRLPARVGRMRAMGRHASAGTASARRRSAARAKSGLRRRGAKLGIGDRRVLGTGGLTYADGPVPVAENRGSSWDERSRRRQRRTRAASRSRTAPATSGSRRQLSRPRSTWDSCPRCSRSSASSSASRCS